MYAVLWVFCRPDILAAGPRAGSDSVGSDSHRSTSFIERGISGYYPGRDLTFPQESRTELLTARRLAEGGGSRGGNGASSSRDGRVSPTARSLQRLSLQGRHPPRPPTPPGASRGSPSRPLSPVLPSPSPRPVSLPSAPGRAVESAGLPPDPQRQQRCMCASCWQLGWVVQALHVVREQRRELLGEKNRQEARLLDMFQRANADVRSRGNRPEAAARRDEIHSLLQSVRRERTEGLDELRQREEPLLNAMRNYARADAARWRREGRLLEYRVRQEQLRREAAQANAQLELQQHVGDLVAELAHVQQLLAQGAGDLPLLRQRQAELSGQIQREQDLQAHGRRGERRSGPR